jgi:hypothetical protein
MKGIIDPPNSHIAKADNAASIITMMAAMPICRLFSSPFAMTLEPPEKILKVLFSESVSASAQSFAKTI